MCCSTVQCSASRWSARRSRTSLARMLPLSCSTAKTKTSMPRMSTPNSRLQYLAKASLTTFRTQYVSGYNTGKDLFIVACFTLFVCNFGSVLVKTVASIILKLSEQIGNATRIRDRFRECWAEVHITGTKKMLQSTECGDVASKCQ